MNEEEYRQNLRSEINRRKILHQHYSANDIAKIKLKRRQELEGKIAESKEELDQIKPQGIVKGLINRIWPRRS
jgi:multidrug resistance efflux pump